MTKIRHTILALVPPNKEGALVLKEALFFQEALGMKLEILNIIEPSSFYIRNFEPEIINDLLANAKRKLVDFVIETIGDKPGENVMVTIKSGKVVSLLKSLSKESKYEFILIDKSEDNYEGALNNAQIDDLLSESTCPVLTVHKDFGVPKIENIVIPIDITQATKKRLLWATLFAKKLGAKITILSALNADVNISVEKSLAFKNAKKIRHMLWEQDVDCEVEVLRTRDDKKHEPILEYIEKEKPGMIIIRTHQESIFASTGIGEFVSGIVHGCKNPVLTVNYTPSSLASIFW
jgi:nucleotide-binding universal stress UspA family protein